MLGDEALAAPRGPVDPHDERGPLQPGEEPDQPAVLSGEGLFLAGDVGVVSWATSKVWRKKSATVWAQPPPLEVPRPTTASNRWASWARAGASTILVESSAGTVTRT
jgi:hypothetical protein